MATAGTSMDPILTAELQERLLTTHALHLVTLLARALRRDGYHVEEEPIGPRGRELDILASKGNSRLAIEVKRVELLSRDVLYRAMTQVDGFDDAVQRVVAYPGTASREVAAVAAAHRVELWGMDRWATLLVPTGIADELLGLNAKRREVIKTPSIEFARRGDALRQRLLATARGDEGWKQYQDLMADIAEYLFAPSLGAPDRESSDVPRRNRRDFVMENVADDGFWLRARQRYDADYIVFDAKNYVAGIPKKCVIEIAHYLKPYGLGMFGIIFTREEPSGGAKAAVREQWAGSRRMIAVVTDEMTLDMLERKQNGTGPEVRLAEWIASLRKGM
jgi:hypothetical protein